MSDLDSLHDLVLIPGELDLLAVAQLFTHSFDANGSIVFVVAIGLTIAQSAATLHTCIGVLQVPSA